jgi:glucose-1-phosphate adenylyltransferase
MNQTHRFVSRLTRNTLALVLAGGRGSRLQQLTLWRAKPAVPFGGKFRIIDFPLSNCMNSGIRMIGVITQYKAHSLIQHIQQGWGFLRGEFGEFIELLPAQQRIEPSWYAGTADAVYQNLDIIRTHKPEYVLILAGDHVYKMDYGPMIAHHVERGADMTVGCIEVPLEQAKAFGVMSIQEDGRVIEFNEKPASPHPMPGSPDLALASMGIYIFNTHFLFEQLIKDADETYSTHDFGHDIIPDMIKKYRVFSSFRESQSGRARTGGRRYGRCLLEANLELIGFCGT